MGACSPIGVLGRSRHREHQQLALTKRRDTQAEVGYLAGNGGARTSARREQLNLHVGGSSQILHVEEHPRIEALMRDRGFPIPEGTE